MLNELKLDLQTEQLKGLPFTISSIFIWGIIAIIQFTSLTIEQKNLGTFICSSLLLPIATVCGKILNVNLFKSENPLAKLGFIFSMNQVLYIIIVMLIMYFMPNLMLLSYAIVFAAHLLPYSWLYDSKTYKIGSILLTFAVVVIRLTTNNFYLSVFIVIYMIIFDIMLWKEINH